MSGRKAFTLIELLVVVGVIALLMAFFCRFNTISKLIKDFYISA
ncbi:MAG: type II secretion system protein [Planctomycetota bacterium]|jgi:prepilin-type N-terminal cleavage/methylation domain-containing protein